MTEKLETVLEKVSTIPNPVNSCLIQEFYQFMADNRKSDSYKKNNLKALVLFSHELGPNLTFYDIQKKEKIFEFLNKRIKLKSDDPDEKWVTTWNDYLGRLKFFFRWLYNDDIKGVVDSASSLAGNISVTFPVVAPYVAMGTTVAKGLTDLLERLDEHDAIIDSNLRLDVADDNTGYQVLQTGHLICFDEPQEEALLLKPNMDIYHKEPQGGPFIDGSYAVYSIRKVDYQEPFWEIDQKIAKLLSELDGKGNSSRAPVDFLRDTMEGYTAFRKIQRYYELQIKGNGRTPEEEQLFNKLAQDTTIKPYLTATTQ
jgi:hypothetical protein